jgi:hypothetical protein
MGRRHKGRKPQGFSERPFKGAWNVILGRFGVTGSEKRSFFNDLALYAALGLGAVLGLVGYETFAPALGAVGGVIAALLAAVGGFSIVADLMARDRYFRP